MSERTEVDSLRKMIRNRTSVWATEGTWVEPEWTEALDFMVTEAGEALDAKLRYLHADFVRTHAADDDSERELFYNMVTEIGQTLMMAVITLEKMGVTPQSAVSRALGKMDAKRVKGRYGTEG